MNNRINILSLYKKAALSNLKNLNVLTVNNDHLYFIEEQK